MIKFYSVKITRFLKYISYNFCGLSLFAFLFSSISFPGQTKIDTLNQFDASGKKHGYWTIYYDSLFKRCEEKTAKYYCYSYYINGKPTFETSGPSSKKNTISYVPVNPHDTLKFPILLNGEVIEYEPSTSTKKPRLQESYKNGKITSAIEYFNWSSEAYPEMDIYCLDCLYNNDPTTYLSIKKERNVTVYQEYKHYYSSKPLTERNYLVRHRDFKYLFRPLVGVHVFRDNEDTKARLFIEAGFSKKYTPGSHIDTIDMTYRKDRWKFHSLNFSLMGSNTYNKFVLGQKITYGYNFVLLRGEAGIVNYTDFKTTDLAAIFGIGFSVFGYLHEMFYVSVPLYTRQPAAYPRLSFSILIN